MMVTRATRDDLSLFRMRLADRANRRFKFHKRSQHFIRLYNETLSVVAMRVSNEDCSSATING